METESNYQAALEYLYRFVDFSLTRGFHFSPDQFELGRMRDFMAYLGHPEQSYPILHVAGTKGKGSVAAMCASALRAAGYRVGLYTSPHLMDYAERIQVDGRHIPHQDLVALVEEIKPYLEAGTRLTTFEITTALAFLYFARQGVTAVVAEVGLGGRLDATNVVTPRVAVITSISYDHMNVLGHTLAEIAGEKAGIIKPGVPVVLSPQKDEARRVVESVAAEQAAALVQVGREVLFAPVSHSLDGQTFLAWRAEEQAQMEAYLAGREVEGWQPVRLAIPLLGLHQVENAATAYAALQIARQQGLKLDEAAIRTGFAQVSWPGRFEVLRREPPVVIDSAHNRDSAMKLCLALDDYYPGREVVLVFGASEDKDIEGMFAELMPRVQQVVATRSYHPRAMEPERLVELAQRYGKPARVVAAVEDALVEAMQLAGREALVLATGSLFVAAGVRETWYNGSIDLEAGKTAV